MKNNYDVSHAIRLLPGVDLKMSIHQYVNKHKIKAGWILTCVGSLTSYNIRQFAGGHDNGYFEIVSLAGIASKNGSYIHISIADSTGKTIGGHLLQGCTIYTTAEIIITESSGYIFTRKTDNKTSYTELQIKEK